MFRHKEKTLKSKLLIPLIFLLTLQTILLFAFFSFGTPSIELSDKTVNTFTSESMMNSKNIQNIMLNNWSDISDSTKRIKTILTSPQIELEGNQPTLSHYLELVNELNFVLRKNRVTDSYIIFNSDTETKKALYIRNANLTSGLTYLDYTIEIAPTDVKEYLRTSYGYDVSVNYETQIQIDDSESNQFYNIPTENAISYGVEAETMIYWSDTFKLHSIRADVLTCSVPILNSNGEVLAVFGIGVTKNQIVSNHLNKYNSSAEMGMLIAKKDNNNNMVSSILSNNKFFTALNSDTPYTKTRYDNVFEISVERKKLYACVTELIISDDEVSQNNEWYCITLVSKSSLLSGITDSRNQIILISILGLFISIVIGILFCLRITKPVKKLTSQIDAARKKGYVGFAYEKLYIKELDFFIAEFMTQVNETLAIPAKLSQIIQMSDLNIAAYEVNKVTGSIFITDSFYELLNLKKYYPEALNKNSLNINYEEFKKWFDFLESHLYGNDSRENEFTYKLDTEKYEDGIKYITLKRKETDDLITGVLRDITFEIKEKQKMENERDIDVLTGLLNRRGFELAVDQIWRTKSLQNAMLIMIDLDNLKKINDTYGHLYGDNYIQIAGKTLSGFSDNKTYISHLSGDEFMIFKYGSSSKDDLINDVYLFFDTVRSQTFEVRNTKISLKLSAGVAFYEPNISYNELRSRADFAMYEVKNSGKNRVKFFNMSNYRKMQIELEENECIRELLLQRAYQYAFQPIIDLKKIEVFGYEALLRPNYKNIDSPTKVLDLIKKFDLQMEFESTTVYDALTTFKNLNSNKRLFINSITSSIMSPEFFDTLMKNFSEILPNLIIEFTEDTTINAHDLKSKIKNIRRTKAKIAIDDYGVGFSNMSSILNYNPYLIKIDRSLIRNISKNKKQQTLLKTMIKYSKEYRIKVLAEGIETLDDLKTVLDLGFDYAQGFIFSSAKFDLVDISDEMKAFLKKNQKKN